MKYQNYFFCLWFILACMALSSCLSYMKEDKIIDSNSLEDEILLKKSIYRGLAKEQYLVLRYNNEMWHLFDMKFSDDQKTFTAKRETIAPAYQQIIDLESNNLSYTNSQKDYISQVHFFVDAVDENDDSITIALNDIEKLEIYQHDSKKSNLNTTVAIVVLSPLTAAAVLAIAYVIICNCPYVYSEIDGNNHFEGNLFTGSMYPSIEREDYIPIRDNYGLDGRLSLSIANENKEVLNINQLSLINIKHKPGVKVLIDKQGLPHTISESVPPIESNSFEKFNHTEELIDAEGIAFDFSDPEIDLTSKMSELDLVFNSDANVDKGKLVLRVKNTIWGAMIYDEVSRMLGKQYEWFHEREAKRSREEMEALMRKGGMLMSVSILKEGDWELIDYVWPTGSKAYREVVIPIDIDKIEDDKIKIRLEAGFKFWEVDQASMDFSKDLEMEISESFAISGERGLDQEITELIRNDDDKYMSHLSQGEAINLTFDVEKTQDDMQSSYFLQGKGYYKVEREYDNQIRIGELLRFRREGGFSYYSYKKFNNLMASLEVN